MDLCNFVEEVMGRGSLYMNSFQNFCANGISPLANHSLKSFFISVQDLQDLELPTQEPQDVEVATASNRQTKTKLKIYRKLSQLSSLSAIL